MTGQELKEKLLTLNISQSELARRLDMSHQSFNQALKVSDVKSGFLEKICVAAEVEMSFFYPNGFKKSDKTTMRDRDTNEMIKTILEQNNRLLMTLMNDGISQR